MYSVVNAEDLQKGDRFLCVYTVDGETRVVPDIVDHPVSGRLLEGISRTYIVRPSKKLWIKTPGPLEQVLSGVRDLLSADPTGPNRELWETVRRVAERKPLPSVPGSVIRILSYDGKPDFRIAVRYKDGRWIDPTNPLPFPPEDSRIDRWELIHDEEEES